MLLLIIFAFIAGIVTILSPCILPILPIVLSGSLGGGKRRPFGVITGFIVSFTFFTLFLATIVTVTGISADSLRTVSVVIVFLFGLSLLLPQFQVLTERMFSKLSGMFPVGQRGTGFFSGFLIGLSLGLVWTPCVGPILASVISLALTGSVSTTAVFITLAYATGTALPLLAITYGGRNLLQKNLWLLNKSSAIQKIFGVLMMLTALGIFFNIDRKFQTYILELFPQYGIGLTKFEDNTVIQEKLNQLNKKPVDSSLNGKTTRDLTEQGMLAPELKLGGQWFNSEPLKLEQLHGKVVLIDFWTYTCINCIRTLPYLRDWHQKYANKGLVIIGVHTPEFAFEKVSKNVEQAIKDFDLRYPIMQDNDYATWQAYNNRYWPAKYFIDKNGRIRFTHFGEGAYDESERIIQELLTETGEEITDSVNNKTYVVESKTPELYVGYDRIQYLASPELVKENNPRVYSYPENLDLHSFSFNGSWNVSREYSAPQKGSSLRLHYFAKHVFLVMRSKNETSVGKIHVILDGKTVTDDVGGEDVVNGTVTVDKNRLYKLIESENASDHILELQFQDSNVEVYAFTFG